MNNEPVAWMDEINTFVLDTDYKQFPKSLQNGMIPLYTHPAKEQDTDCQYCKQGCIRCDARKQLTDEEIYRLLADSIWAVGLNTDCLDEQNWADGITVARAILRKASEK